VGAAIGGVIGGIVGYMEETKTDEQNRLDEKHQQDVDNAMTLLNAELSANETKHQAVMNSLQIQHDTALAEGNTKLAQELAMEMDNKTQAHDLQMSLLQQQKDSVEKLSSAYGRLSDQLINESKFNAGVDAAFELDWAGGKQVDLGELQKVSGMSTDELVSDIIQVLGADALTTDQISILASGNDVERKSNEELYNILESWRVGRIELDKERNATLREEAANAKLLADKEREMPSKLAEINKLNSMMSTSLLESPNKPGISEALMTLAKDKDGITERDVRNIKLSEKEEKLADKDGDGIASIEEKFDFLLSLMQKNMDNRKNRDMTLDQQNENIQRAVTQQRPGTRTSPSLGYDSP
jgi:hypothetical protein